MAKQAKSETRGKRRKKVSIIIVNYKGERFLETLFATLKMTKYPNYEIIFVDNASPDRSVEIVKKYKYVKLYQLKQNLGFTGGNNYGIKKATGDYVLLLNNDVIMQPDWLDKLVDALEADKDAMIAGGVMMPMHLFGMIDTRKVNRIFPRTIPAHMISGSCTLVKREFVDKVGGLDDDLFIYWEETAYCWRANMMGYKVLWVHDCYYYHYSGGFTKVREISRKQLRENRKRFDSHFYYYRNEMIYYLKNLSFLNMAVKLPRPILRAGYFLVVKQNPYMMLSMLKGLGWIIPRLGKILGDRREIQESRVVPDRVIYKRMEEKNRISAELNSYYKSVEKKLIRAKGEGACDRVPPPSELRIYK